eukprot:TRINITY_DN6633_c0_g1_i1.p1 TRINITY_DN6633_c0_g1~~TRINITY_DN6633_c0_g1_i1.p1  ORF type:complete len:502 (-),score=115.20 TRINITY_DN6633_c0_g1_i1:233-1738(-)
MAQWTPASVPPLVLDLDILENEKFQLINDDDPVTPRLTEDDLAILQVETTPDSDPLSSHIEDSLILDGEYTTILVEHGEAGVDLDLTIEGTDYYSQVFMKTRHYNYIGSKGSEEIEHFVVSVMAIPDQEVIGYRALQTSKRGHSEYILPIREEIFTSDSITILRKLQDKFPNNDLYMVDDEKFSEELSRVEIEHPQRLPAMKIGLICCNSTDENVGQSFLNEPSEAFWEFVNLMGHEIDLDTWTKYRGDMGASGKTYYDEFIASDGNTLDVIYHLAPMMGPEGHRRLIGNDVAVIFFLEDDGKFDPTLATGLGTVPQVFSVVKPLGNNQYKVNFFNNINIKKFGPQIPPAHFDGETLKNIILTKMHNGYSMTKRCPPLARLFYLPRGAQIEDLIEKYPKQAKKNKKKKTKKKNKSIGKVKLDVKLIAGQDLAVKDKLSNTSDPFCILTVGEQSYKSKVIKNKLDPIWGEIFTFELDDINIYYNDFTLECFDWNRVGGSDFM